MPGIGATENSQSGMYPNCFIGKKQKTKKSLERVGVLLADVK